ncbi:MAG: 30S ribosomal protein S20 [Candidatus Berkelbacteria bacterium]|nr:30S ribosomal protein S20 [Candidatus Berkelbacteria bacterium]
MPLTSSAKKALKQDRARREINDLTRNKIKSAVKAARLAIAAGDKDASAKLDAAYRELDVASKKNVIHKNRASRLKSRLAKKIAKVSDAPVATKPAKKTPTKKVATKKK